MILFISTTTRETPRSVDAAIDAASRAGDVFGACFILDREAVGEGRARLSQSGFAAEPTEETLDALVGEYRARAAEWQRRMGARTGGEAEVLEGPFVETALRCIGERGAERVIVSKKRRSQYSRILFEDRVADLGERAPCPVEVVEDD